MKHTRIIIGMLIMISGLTLVGSALAANGYAIGRSVIGGGGQEARGADFVLRGTVGEPIASALNVDATHGLSSGFWWSREFRVYLPLVLRN